MKFRYSLRIKNLDKCNTVFLYIILAFLLFAISGFILVFFIHQNNEEEILFLTYIVTAAIAIVAFFEIRQANELKTNELLIFISNRWGSIEIIKARQLIHEIFVKEYRGDEKNPKKNDYDIAETSTSIKIREMSERKDGEFIYILNMLDYLESISSFYVRKQINIEDVNLILGNNICFYYKILEKYIQRRQSYHHFDFINFQRMFHDIKFREKSLELYSRNNEYKQ